MVTLTGTFTRLDGTPATGTVRVMTSRSPIMDPDGKIVISGPQEFPLDQDGTISVPVPASNDPDLGPPFTYWIDVNLSHANWKISKVWIPHGSSTVDLSDIADYEPTPGMETRVVTIPADGADGQVLVWDGAGFVWDYPPEGPQGPKGDLDAEQMASAPRIKNELHDATWGASSATIDSQPDGLIKFTPIARNGYIYAVGKSFTAGEVYYFAVDVKATGLGVLAGSTHAPRYHSGSGEWERIVGRITLASNFTFQVLDTRQSGWEQIEVRNPVRINLTEAFGAGREPTTEYMNALLAKHGGYIGGVDQFVFDGGLYRDTTVGERVLLDYPGGTTMIHGDTGWRNITDRLINGWTAGPSGIVIRRVMDRVYLEVIGLNGTNATAQQFITLPDGWSMGNWAGRRVQLGDKTAVYGAGARSLSLPIGQSHFVGAYEFAEFNTPDAWPSAQTGTPINHR